MCKTLTAVVSAIGPIDADGFEIAMDGPGLYALTGHKESGKSTILRAFQLAATKQATPANIRDAHLSVNFGAIRSASRRKAPAGQVRLPGIGGDAGIEVVGDGARVRRLEAPPSVALLPGHLFASLTRNGLTGKDTREAAELEAFAAITRIECEAAALVPDEFQSDVETIAPGMLTIVQGAVWTRMHARKNAVLEDAAKVGRKLIACQSAEDKDAVKADVPDVSTAALDLDVLEEGLAEKKIARRGRVMAEEQRAKFAAIQPETRPDDAVTQEWLKEARRRLNTEIEQASEGLPPEPDVEKARAALETALDRENTVDAEIMDMRGVIAAYEEKLAAARAELAAAEKARRETLIAVDAAVTAKDEAVNAHADWEIKKAAHDQRKTRVAAQQRDVEGLEQQLREVTEQQRQWDERQALLTAKLDGPEQAEVDKAAADVDVARAILAMARRKEAEAKRNDEEKGLEANHEGLNRLAEAYKVAATDGLQARIGAVLEEHKIDGWAIRDGALWCHDPALNEMIPFYDLSGSAKDLAALKLLIAHAQRKEGAEFYVLVLAQEVCDGMMAADRHELGKLAEAVNVYILTGSVDEGDLRLVKYSGMAEENAA